MATQVLQTLAIYRQDGKEGLVVESEPGEESGQSWKAGAPLAYDASTKEIEIWAGTTDTEKIVGVASAKASGTAGTSVSYYEANDYNLFAASLINAAAAYTLLGTEVGTAYSLIASGDNWYVDVADTSTKKVVVVALIDAKSDVNPRVVIRFLGGMQAKVLQS